MAYIRFVKASEIENAFQRALMVMGNQGQIVHCEIVLDRFQSVVCSTNHINGVYIKDYQPRPEGSFIDYYLGENDAYYLAFFQKNKGRVYSIKNMVSQVVFSAKLNDNSAYCSQICLEAMQEITQIKALKRLNAQNTSPMELLIELEKLNFKRI